MELILQTGLEHQEIPVKAVADVFKNAYLSPPTRYFENPRIDFSDKRMSITIGLNAGTRFMQLLKCRENNVNYHPLSADRQVKGRTGRTKAR